MATTSIELIEEFEPRPTGAGIAKPVPPSAFVRHEAGVAEMRWETVPPTLITPTDRFFVRNQGKTARVDPARWRLRIEGPAVDAPFDLGYDELLRLPAVTLTRALECAGNGRRFYSRQHSVTPPGTRWSLGGIGVAEWTGVPLKELLDRARMGRRAVDVMPIGLDEQGVRRPMPVARAVEDDTILAYAMNGEPLAQDHGFPGRVLVPGWAGIASIKWVGSILVSDRPLLSRWNTEVYVLKGVDHAPQSHPYGRPVTTQVVKSALELPWPARLPPGSITIRGRSWSGSGAIGKVEVSTDGGRRWKPARLLPPNIPMAWTRWEFDWHGSPGMYAIRARATDDHGNTQPDQAPWNELGYLYDAVIAHPVTVVPGIIDLRTGKGAGKSDPEVIPLRD